MEFIIIPLLSIATCLLFVGLSVYYSKEIEDTDKGEKSFERISNWLTPYSRAIFYSLWLIWLIAANFYFLITSKTDNQFLEISVRHYGLASLFFIFLALTPGLLRVLFPHFPFHNFLLTSRRAIGLCAFFFAGLHAFFAFIYNFGGSFSTYFRLTTDFKLAFIFGLSGLFILFLMAITSFDEIEHGMGFKNWKILHRFVYLAGILILVHAFIRGFHFQERSFNFYMTYFSLTFILLELVATTKEVHRRRKNALTRLGFYTVLILIGFAAIFVSMINLIRII